MHGAFDKFTGLQPLKRAGGGGAIEHYLRRQRGLIGGSAPGQRGQKAVLQRREIKGRASFLEQRHVDLMQPPDQKSRPFLQRPVTSALSYCLPDHARYIPVIAALN
jgi:hypothetical protein